MLENVLILGSIWGAFPVPKLVPQIDEKSSTFCVGGALGAFLVHLWAQGGPKSGIWTIFGSILGTVWSIFSDANSIDFLITVFIAF